MQIGYYANDKRIKLLRDSKIKIRAALFIAILYFTFLGFCYNFYFLVAYDNQHKTEIYCISVVLQFCFYFIAFSKELLITSIFENRINEKNLLV